MARQIQDDEELERGRRGNNHAFHCHLINCSIGLAYCVTVIVGILGIAFLAFVVMSGIEYFNYLTLDENKEKLFELLEWIATHSVGVIVGATPFLVLWLKK